MVSFVKICHTILKQKTQKVIKRRIRMAERLVIEDLLDFANGKIKEWPRWEKFKYISDTVDSPLLSIFEPVDVSDIDFKESFLFAMRYLEKDYFRYLPTFFKKVLNYIGINSRSNLSEIENNNDFWRKFIVVFTFVSRYFIIHEIAYDEDLVLCGKMGGNAKRDALIKINSAFERSFAHFGFYITGGYINPAFPINLSSKEFLNKSKQQLIDNYKKYNFKVTH